MTIEAVGIPSDVCKCTHLKEDHQPQCIVIEDNIECMCGCFTPQEEDDWGYWFTDDEGRKLEGRA